MPNATYSCDKHQTVHQRGELCPGCVEAFANRRNPDTMTGEERAAELRWWGHILTIPLDDLKQRCEELVGRGIWSHEFVEWDSLIDEARTRTHPTPQEILDKIPARIPVVVVDAT